MCEEEIMYDFVEKVRDKMEEKSLNIKNELAR